MKMKITAPASDWKGFAKRIQGESPSYFQGKTLKSEPICDACVVHIEEGKPRSKMVEYASLVLADTILEHAEVSGEPVVLIINDLELFIQQLDSFKTKDLVTVEYPFGKEGRVAMYDANHGVEYDFPSRQEADMFQSLFLTPDADGNSRNDDIDFLSDNIKYGPHVPEAHWQAKAEDFDGITKDAQASKNASILFDLDDHGLTLRYESVGSKMNIRRRIPITWVQEPKTNIRKNYQYGVYMIPKFMKGVLDMYIFSNNMLLISDGVMGVSIRQHIPDEDDEYYGGADDGTGEE